MDGNLWLFWFWMATSTMRVTRHRMGWKWHHPTEPWLSFCSSAHLAKSSLNYKDLFHRYLFAFFFYQFLLLSFFTTSSYSTSSSTTRILIQDFFPLFSCFSLISLLTMKIEAVILRLRSVSSDQSWTLRTPLEKNLGTWWLRACCCRFLRFFFVLDSVLFVYDFTYDSPIFFLSSRFRSSLKANHHKVKDSNANHEDKVKIALSFCERFDVIVIYISFQFSSNFSMTKSTVNSCDKLHFNCNFVAISLSKPRTNDRQGKKL